jgi:RNA polymerase sigma factor (sigma-70 family)
MAVAGVVQFLREQVVREELETVTDAQLLQRYVAERDEAAFASLVRRHAAMVWGVCKRVLGHDQHAEDAFQATFMVLVRKAASIRPQSLLGNWLYGVAHQVAVKARAMNAKRMSREKQLPVPIANAAVKPDAWQELQPLLDQELGLLPEKYRVIIVLCDLEGRTRKEAARCLGVPEGTVAGRQARARAMLAKRLARHGCAVAGGSLAALLSQAAASAAPASTVASTIKSASVLAAGGSIAASVAALTEGVVKAMFLSKLKSAVGILLFVLGVSLSAASLSGVFAQGNSDKLHATANEQEPAKADPPKRPAVPAQADKRKVGALAQMAQKVFVPDPPPSYAASLINNKKVQEELGLGSEQIKGVFAAVRKVHEEKYKDDFAELDVKREKLDQAAVSDAAQQLYAKVDKDNLKAIGDVLTPAQMKRFNQIQFQRRLEGDFRVTLLEPDVAKELQWTDKQKRLMASVHDQMAKDQTAAAFNRDLDKLPALFKEAMDTIRKSLDDEQKKKLEALTGKPFAFPQSGATPGNPGGKAGQIPNEPPAKEPDGRVGHIKVEARGRVIAKTNKDGSTPYFLRVDQNKPAPAVEWLIRTRFDKATVIRHVLDLKDTEVVLTGNLAWLPKGARTDSDDDYALGFVIQEKAQLERLDPKDKSPHYIKVEARGDWMILDNSLVVLVQLQEKPATRVIVSGPWRLWGLDRLTSVLGKTKQATIAGYATWEVRTDLVIFRLHAPQLVDPPLSWRATDAEQKKQKEQK